MITKESFKRAITFIKDTDSMLNDLDDVLNKYSCFQDGRMPVFNSSVIVDMLNETFKLKVTEEYGSELEYWLYECDFGKEWNEREVENLNLPENHKYRKPRIDNLDDLYDYLKWIHDTELTDELLGEIVEHENLSKSDAEKNR